MTEHHEHDVSKKEPETVVGRALTAKIRYRGGPISVSEYMREVLANPVGGFYAAKGGSAIGREGHFVTSPEISTLFAETLAAWVLQHYHEVLGSPAKVAFIELGPGRGTLMKQMLTAMSMMQGGPDVVQRMHVHMVEVSHELRQEQFEALGCSDAVRLSQAPTQHGTPPATKTILTSAKAPLLVPPSGRVLRPDAPDPAQNFSEQVVRWGDGLGHAQERLQALTATADAVVSARCGLTGGGPISWHHLLDEVPEDIPCIVIGHEYLDALPVHIFKKDEARGWLEVLVDESQAPDDPMRFRFVLSPCQTKAVQHIALRRLRGLAAPATVTALEVNAEAMAVAESLALRIDRTGGLALFVDYGQDGPYDSSLNAIRRHAPVHPLQEPGAADLTSWVDFDSLRQAVAESRARVATLGPLTQGQFCLANGMEHRLDQLLQGKERSAEEAAALEDGFARLVAGVQHHPQGMGETYKVMAISSTGAATPYPFNLDFTKLTPAA